MIWSSRARNKSAPPLSRRSRGRIESPAPEASEAREPELSIRVNPPFRFCKEIDPNPPKPGKIHTHDSRRCSHQSPISAVFHGRLFIEHPPQRGRIDADHAGDDSTALALRK